ncbi:MAG: polysaccharide biosynthesis/export family protein [bacterium]
MNNFTIMIKNPVLFLFSLFFLFGSCITHKKTVYFQPKQKEPASYKIPQAPAQTIKPNDELLIYVKSEDNISFTQNAPTAIGNDQAIRDYNYSVDRDGNIYYPVIGNFSVKGMTVDEASQKLKEALNSYYNQPEVRIRYNYKIITVLGEVGSPGVLNYSREQITIFEVLAMAGEISETGNRKNVYLYEKMAMK